ncbi:putative rTX toxin, partial [Vibrio parahaemolyticus EKP-008]
LLCVSWR